MPQADWQTAKNQFDATWADSIPEKGKGFKPFQMVVAFRGNALGILKGAQGRFAPNAVWRQTEQERAGRQARANPMPSIWSEATPPGLPLVWWGRKNESGRSVAHRQLRIGLSAPPAVAFGSPLIPGSHTR